MTNAKKPTAAMVEAGRNAGNLPWAVSDERFAAIYTAMRALEPAAPVEDGERLAQLIAFMRQSAKSASEASRIMAEAKTARQTDGGGPYSWAEPEQTVEWEVADRLERLASQPPAADALVAALEQAGRALKPVADRVFNDNGDHTISTAPFDESVYSKAYFAERKVSAALAKQQGGGE